MHFRILGKISQIELIATGHGIKELPRLNKIHGRCRWRKLKGHASIKLSDGSLRQAELHWYEGHGIGKIEFKIKRYLV